MSRCLLKFNSERLDPVGNHYHLGKGYRVYNPELMRFSCPDSWSPFGRGGINPYAYCHADPINQSDPSGHFSWQAGLGIGLGMLGLLTAAFTAGASLAVAGSLSAALGASSAITLATGAAGLVADVTGLVSNAMDHSNPKAASLLGWISFAAGILSFGTGLAAGGYRLLNKTAVAGDYEVLTEAEHASLPELNAAQPLSDIEKVSGNPVIMPRILRHLSGLDVDRLRATSTTMLTNVEKYLKDLESLTVPMAAGQEIKLTEALREPRIQESHIEALRDIWRGKSTLTPPSRLSLSQFNPAKPRYLLGAQREFIFYHEVIPVRAKDNSFLHELENRNQIFKIWQALFRDFHPDDFANV
ncbi:RHS repeat-associated core domain-containing protein [Winslowiella iniecta]|nr:RHS repeat-associated core domain-containing protein [Winslowiella iniecta]